MGRGVPNWMTGLSFGAVGDVVVAAPVVAVVDVGAASGGIKIIHFQKKKSRQEYVPDRTMKRKKTDMVQKLCKQWS